MEFQGVFCRIFAILLLVAPAMLNAQSDYDQQFEECCRRAFEGCRGSGDDYGPFNLGAFCAIYDYYGRNSNREGASEKLKAAQKCIEQACPYNPPNQKQPPPPKEEKRLPVIFLPGVAGSILEARGRELWPLAPFGDRADLAVEPDGITPASGAKVVAGDVLRGRPKMDFYGDFINSLKSIGYVENTDLFVFPYDWRLDNASHYIALDQVIDRALAKNGSKKVILTAHSMGGII
ncbi:MAG: lipase/acyltransferase domain-containing protein, partial [Acidobacteriota bacterium]